MISMANKVESLSIRKAAKPTTMQLAVQNLSHFPKSSRGPAGVFALHLMSPPIYRILIYVKYTHAA